MEMEQILVGHMAVFCYLVWCPDKKEALLIDPAGNEEELVEKLAEKELTLKYIVNTHGHYDHTGGNVRIKEMTGTQIVMHKSDSDLFSSDLGQQMATQMGYDPTPPADITVTDGDTIRVGNVTLAVIHTPGHSPGCISLLTEGNLFTGDTLFGGGVGRTDLPGSSMHAFLKSPKEKLLPLPDETVVWPGHDYGPAPSSTIGMEKKLNPFLRQLI